MDSQQNSDYEQDFQPQNFSPTSQDKEKDPEGNTSISQNMKPNFETQFTQNNQISEESKNNQFQQIPKVTKELITSSPLENSKLQNTNEQLQIQLLSLSKQIDEIIHSEKERFLKILFHLKFVRRYNKYHKITEASGNNTIQQLQQELSSVLGEIKQLNLQLQSLQRQIKNGEQINQIASKHNIIQSLKQEYHRVKEEQIALQTVGGQIDKSLEGIKNSDFYKEKKTVVDASLRKAKLEGQELNLQFEEMNLELKEEHEQRVTKSDKIVKIKSRLHEKKVQTNKKLNLSKSHNDELQEEKEPERITQEIVEELINQEEQLKNERISLLQEIEKENKQKSKLQTNISQDLAQSFDENHKKKQDLKLIQLKIRLLNQQSLLETLTQKRNLKLSKDQDLLKNKLENKHQSQSATTTHKYSIQTKIVFSRQNLKPNSTKNKQSYSLLRHPQLKKKIIVKNKQDLKNPDKSLQQSNSQMNFSLPTKPEKQIKNLQQNQQQELVNNNQQDKQKTSDNDEQNYSNDQFESIDQ